MKQELNEIEINGVQYVKKGTVKTVMADDLEGKPYVIVRAESAGVHAGYLESKNGQEVVLVNSRRIWYWDGACSLSQIALEGVKKPENCKFSVEIPRIEVLGVVEILYCSQKAKEIIQGVKEWKS